LTGDCHVGGLRQPDHRAIGRVDGDFGLVAALFDGQNHLGFEAVAQDFADFSKPGFDIFADGRSNFVPSTGVFHVHRATSKKFNSLNKIGHSTGSSASKTTIAPISG
jgi:hypothetical protein